MGELRVERVEADHSWMRVRRSRSLWRDNVQAHCRVRGRH